MRTSNGRQRSSWAAVAAGLVLLAGGCGGSGSDDAASKAEAEVPVVQPGAPGEPSRVISAEEAAAAGKTEHTRADVDFMRGMIHHHAQALVMTNMVRERSGSREVPLFARRIEISQEAELETMERWLTDRGEEPPTDEEHAHDHGGLMPGMLDQDDLEQLAAARGPAFDRRFLRAMRRHHRGALRMVADLRETDGGLEVGIDAFARHVVADQSIEIGRIRELLAADPATLTVRRARPSKAAAERMTKLAFAGGKPRICVLVGS